MHEGHRERLKQRFRDEGLEHFSEINILELLLFYSVPRRDTNPTAHQLLDKYGSLVNVLEAEYEDLLNVDGISSNSATLIKLVMQLSRYYLSSKNKPGVILPNRKAAAEYLVHTYIGEKNEIVKFIMLDSKGKILSINTMFEGNFNSVDINMRKIVETAIITKAASIIMAHNHPGGIAIPSEEDLVSTRHIKKVLNSISVELLDHIIIADDDYVSLYESGAFHSLN